MDAQMFQKHSFRTMKPELDKKEQLTQMGLALWGETGEVHTALLSNNRESICEEIGDVCFYIANTCTFLGKKLESLMDEPRGNDPITLLFNAYRNGAIFADLVKKHAYQEHELNEKLLGPPLYEVFSSMIGIMAHYGLTTKEVYETNHIKIMKRYPHGFEAERSVNRHEQVQQ